MLEEDQPPDPAPPETPKESITPSTDSNSQVQTSLFQSLDSSLAAESESDDEPDLHEINEKWAGIMLKLDGLKQAAGGKTKGKKGKSNGVILETSEMRGLKEQMAKLEKEYMFSRKEAGW